MTDHTPSDLVARVLLVSPLTQHRDQARILLRRDPRCRVVGDATTAQEALRILKASTVDVVIADMIMPGVDGVRLATVIRREALASRVILLAELDSDLALSIGVEAGAETVLDRDTLASTLILQIAGPTPQEEAREAFLEQRARG